MKPTKGLHLDARPEDQPEGTYPYGKNGVQNNVTGSVTNEPGFERILSGVIPQGYQHMGTITTDSDRTIVFFTNNVYSCIRVVNLTTGTWDYDFTDANKPYKLGFSTKYPIRGITQRNYLGELVCTFTDRHTFAKFLNVDNPQTSTLREWNLFPECFFPTTTKSIELGGILPVGAYFVITRYKKHDGTTTGFSPVSSGIAMVSDTNESITTKSLVIQLSDLDQTYDFIEVAIISRIKGVITAGILTKSPVLPGTVRVTYSGQETLETISLDEALINPVQYDKVGSMAQLNDALYVGKLHRTEVLDMQPYANQVKIFWTSELLDLQNPPEEHKSGQKKGFMHQEVYGIYIRYKLSNGTTSIWFHIPGQELTSGDDDVSTAGQAGAIPSAPKFKLEDCIHTYSAPTKTGVPGAYYNDTELYPNTAEFDGSSIGGEDLRNQRVRHHKMPSLKWCKDNLYPTEADYGKNKLDILGLIASNVSIPSKYQNIIVGYELGYAKRTVANMTVYGQSLMLHGATTSTATLDNKVYSNGHNWSVVSNPGPNTYNPNRSFLRFHAFDILFNKPGFSPSFIASQYKLTIPVDVKNNAYAYTNGTSIAATGTGFTTVLMDCMQGVVGSAPTNNLNAVENGRYIINNTQYSITANTPVGTFLELYNRYVESVYTADIKGTLLSNPTTATDPTGQGTFPANSVASAYLVNLCDVKPNVYDKFYTQEIVSAGDFRDLGDTTPFWGGDIFVCPYTFHTYGVLDYFNGVQTISGTDFPLDRRGRRVVNRVVCETIANLYTRYEEQGNDYSKWFPHNILGQTLEDIYPLKFNGNIDPNQVGYTRGNEAINDLVPDSIYNPYQKYVSDYPYRIHRGGKLSRENTRSWRTFLALDYYEVQKNLGFIEHLEGMDDRLLIHMTNSLMVSQDKGKLEGGMLTVTLGAGDIFQFEPQEVVSSKLGYAGTQHDLACIRTPIGYTFPDAKQGAIYLYKDKQIVQLSLGVYRFLREYLHLKGDNPYSGNGITLGWDQQYKRLLATVKNRRPKNKRQDDVVVINSPADIIEMVTFIGPPNQPATLITKNGIVKPGDIVFMNNRYLKYYGINNVTSGATSPYTCPPVIASCASTITGLRVSLTNDPVYAKVTYGSSAPTVYWELYEVRANGIMSLVDAQTTTQMFADFGLPPLKENTLYIFTIWPICDNGERGSKNSIAFSTQAPPVIIVSPGGGGPTTQVMVHVTNAPVEHHVAGCGKTDKGNAAKFDLTINGTVVGTDLGLSVASCTQPPFSPVWNHSSQVGPSHLVLASGSLTNATVQIDLKDILGNPATLTTGLNVAPMFKSDLTPTNGTVSGSTVTWTNVNISPSFLTYIHIAFLGDN